MNVKISHNPYFNRWFSAIRYCSNIFSHHILVTILILIDGFLQSGNTTATVSLYMMSQSLF